jgi:hypothetical protein
MMLAFHACHTRIDAASAVRFGLHPQWNEILVTDRPQSAPQTAYVVFQIDADQLTFSDNAHGERWARVQCETFNKLRHAAIVATEARARELYDLQGKDPTCLPSLFCRPAKPIAFCGTATTRAVNIY